MRGGKRKRKKGALLSRFQRGRRGEKREGRGVVGRIKGTS